MADKKMLSTIIKRLDRAVGVLDNCCETGEMSEATRMRLIEMLNSAVMDIYYIGKEKLDTPTTSDKEEIPPANNIVSMEENEETIIASSFDYKINEPQQSESKNSEADSIINDFLNIHNSDQNNNINEKVFIENEEVFIENKSEEAAINVEELAVIEPISSTIEITEVENKEKQDDILFEIETPSHIDYPIQVAEEKEEEEQQAINTPVNIVDDTAQQQAISDEKAKLSGLRNQLEDERKRLEEELLSWQKEKMKREEEMLAAERLLAALEAETQKRKNQIATDPAPTNQNITSSYEISSEEPVLQVVEPAQPIVQPSLATITTQPIITPNITIATSHTTTLADKFANNRQFLHEAYENEELKMQGITSIPDLTKAIGINDKFQFIKELFGGDSDRYTDTIRTLNTCSSLENALNHINAEFNWDKNNDTVKRMILLIRRRYM